MGLHDPAQLLLMPDARQELLSLLPPPEARTLAELLEVKGADPYDALERMSVRRGSRRAANLLDFFSVAATEDERDPEAPAAQLVTPSHGLFVHQRVAASEVLNALNAEPGRVLLHMPTGSGKTRTAMNVIAHWLNNHEPRLVVWLAHSEELCEQAVEEFIEAWSALGSRPVTVGRAWGERSLDEAADFEDGLVVAGLAKTYAAARSSVHRVGRLAGRVSLIVMDEAHQAIAPSYQLVLDLLAHAGVPTPLLGLSATPGRTWNDVGEDERLADFFFRRKVTLRVPGFANPIDYLVDEGYLASTKFESLFYNPGAELSERDLLDLASSMDIPARLLQQLAYDQQRNLAIVRRAEEMQRRHRRLLIFAATVEHAVVLSTVLRARGLWAAAVTADTPSVERSRLISTFRSDAPEPRVLVNYGVLTTGFDAPLTSGAIIARPTRSLVLFSQMVGRAIRGPKAGGNAEAEVATVVDTQLPGFSSLAQAFSNWEDVW